MCAIFGIAGEEEASYLTYLGLHSLQHRGQEGAGIVSRDGNDHHVLRKRGLVSEIGSLDAMKGNAAIGHTRYSTTGSDTVANLQPLCMKSSLGWVSIAHNGNLTNAAQLTAELEKQGAIFQTSTDTEVIMHLMARCRGMDIPDALVCALARVEGAYSLLVLDKRYMIAMRDPHGFRPLMYGDYRGKPVFSSETCAFDLIGIVPVREVRPGEMMIVDLETGKVESRQAFQPVKQSRCVFELIYFSRPDSKTFQRSVYETRKALGRRLAQEQPAEVDLVVPVPDSGIAAAIGYAEELSVPFEMGIIRSHYVGRTFIQPKQSLRDLGVRLKLNPVKEILRGRRVVVIDDSLVRGTTSKKIIAMVRESGAKEVHFRVSSPETISPCFYGIDTPTKDQLLAADSSLEDIQKYIGADSIGYLSLEGLRSVTGEGFCQACFSGDYPTLIQLKVR